MDAFEGATAPPLLSAYSERAQIPAYPGNGAPEPNARTACPHDDAGALLWASPSTWSNNVVPSADLDATITLPDNAVVLITSCTFDAADRYGHIIVPSTSKLIFSDAQIEWHVRSIRVEGALLAGSSTCRLHTPSLRIVFHGTKNDGHQKGLHVTQSGVLDLHGKEFWPTWTRLAATATAGDDRVHLQVAPANWEAGQQVLITTSLFEDSIQNENDVRTIKSISGRTVQFTEPLAHSHYGGAEYQCEVGLLSRRIVLESVAAESDADGYGAHVMVEGNTRVRGVQALRLGQTNVLLRYPFHFHMLGHSSVSMLRDASCLHSYYRCVVVHGTHDMLVHGLVAYDTLGSAVYLEDGVEENNTVNLRPKFSFFFIACTYKNQLLLQLYLAFV